MKRFTFRLFLIRKLIESLTWSCIDEYPEYEDIANGLGNTLWAMARMKAGVATGMYDYADGNGYQPDDDGCDKIVPPTGGSGTVKK